MIVTVFVFLVGLSSVGATPGLPMSSGCGPECAGSCFAGNCLFTEKDVDDEDSFRSAQRQATGLLPAHSPQGHSPQLPHLLQQMGVPGATATAGLGFQSMGVLDNKAQELSYELQRAEAHEALLQAQNQQLRRQLDQWKAAGTNIAEREAKVVALLGKPGSQKPAAPVATLQTAAAPPGTSAKAASGKSEPSMLQRAARYLWIGASVDHSYFGLFLMTAGIMLMVACAWKTWYFIQQLRKGEVSWQGMSQALANKANSQRLQPVLHAMGLARYKVEVSEIHLGSIFAGSSDVRVNFRMGNGNERRTKVLKNADGTFLRFDDVLELSMCSSDSPCCICVTDRRGDLAHVELAASEFIRLATRPHQEYFRTELTASRALGDISSQRPYVAMRMRNIIATPATAPAGIGGKDKAKDKQRAYGSFAV